MPILYTWLGQHSLLGCENLVTEFLPIFKKSHLWLNVAVKSHFYSLILESSNNSNRKWKIEGKEKPSFQWNKEIAITSSHEDTCQILWNLNYDEGGCWEPAHMSSNLRQDRVSVKERVTILRRKSNDLLVRVMRSKSIGKSRRRIWDYFMDIHAIL